MCAFFLVLFLGRGNLVVQGNKTQITALARDQVVTEIKRQADPDHDDQVLPEQVFLFDESLHTPNESQTIPWVKQKRDMNQHVVWVQLENRFAKRFF